MWNGCLQERWAHPLIAMAAFNLDFLQKRCPAVGIDLIRRILRQEREASRLECLGRGPDAHWRKK